MVWSFQLTFYLRLIAGIINKERDKSSEYLSFINKTFQRFEPKYNSYYISLYTFSVSLYGMLEQNLPITNCKTFTEPNSPRAERNQWHSPHWSDTQDFNSKWNLFSELFNLVAVNFYIFVCKSPYWYWLESLPLSLPNTTITSALSSGSVEISDINGARAPLNNKPSGGICQRWWSDNKITSLSVWRGQTRPKESLY